MKTFLHNLRRAGYGQFHLAFGDGNMRLADWLSAAADLKGELRDLVDLFLLGRTVAAKKVLPLVGAEVIRDLIEAGVLRQDKAGFTSNAFMLVNCRSYLLFCQLVPDTRAYFGEDSVALATLQSRVPGGKVLDLCAGPGIQSFVASTHAREVTGVEIRPETCRVAELNKRLNGLNGKVKFVCDSVEHFARTDRGRYDLILSNPPLVPWLPGYSSALAADGGTNGLAISAQIIRGYHDRLTETGRIEFIGMGLGRGRRPGVADEIGALARRCSLTGRVHLLSRHPIQAHTPLFEAYTMTFAAMNRLELPAAREKVAKHYARLGFDTFWLFFASLERRAGARAKDLSTVDLTDSFYGGWFV